MIRNKVNDLFWSPKQKTSKQKSLSDLNVPLAKISRKNRRRVDYGGKTAYSRPTFIDINIVNASTTKKGPGRVDCIEMMATRPTLPGVEN